MEKTAQDKILKLSLFLMFVFVLLGISPSSYNITNIKEIFLSFFSGILLLLFLLQKKPVLLPETLIFFTLVLWAVISLLFSKYQAAGLVSVFRITTVLFLFFVIANQEVSPAQLIRKIFLITSIPVIIIALMQMAIPHIFSALMAFDKRIPATFGNPNFFGAYLTVLLPFIFSCDFAAFKKNLWIKYFAVGLIILLAFKTGSKATMVGIMVELCVYIFLSYRDKIKNKLIFKIEPALLISGFVILILIALLFIHGMHSVSFRLQVWMGTISLAFHNMLTGTGPATFALVFPSFRPIDIIKNSYMHSYEVTYPENILLQTAAEYGLPGLLILVFTLWIVLKKRNTKSRDYYSAFCGLLVVNMAGVDVNYAPSAMMFGILAGVLMQDREGKKITLNIKMQIAALVCVITITIFMMVILFKNHISDIYLSRAISASDARQWNIAVENYKKSLGFNKNNLTAAYFLASAYYDSNPVSNAPAALSWLEEVEKNAPDYVLLHYKKAVILNSLGREDEALLEYEKMAKIDPFLLPALVEPAYIYYKQGNIDKALEKLELAVKTGAKDAAVYNNLGNIYFMKKRVNDAIITYKKAIEINPDKDYYYNLGCVYFTLNEINEARQNIYKAAEISLKEGKKEAKIDNMIKLIKQYEQATGRR